ncbi:MAG TPA: histidine kinase dimerization/phospho-acceptor domain-containing protein, partial [Candidatus Sulfomarinibacteraceae bacterium]|nr:histidine kinase dimerization/phospho-acceptor domain-containing protein [Candidatus Sulfomarinibacteraceae bacterium]
MTGGGHGSGTEPQRVGPGISFRARLTLGLIAGAVIPLAGFGAVLVAAEFARAGGLDSALSALVLFTLAAAIIVAVLFAYFLAGNLTAPLRAISRAVERVSAGDLSARVEVAGEDELARLVESHNRLAADLERRNRELGRILLAIGETSPRDGLDRLVAHATASAQTAFEMIDASIYLGDAGDVPTEEVIPGESRPVRAVLSLPEERVGVLTGHLPATRRWEVADQDLLELFASEIAVAIRNAELFEQVQRQTERLVELDAAKDDFLRGISHNLQTPLTSIRAYAEQLAAERDDRRLAIITEQSERLSRMVRQLLAVSRLEAGTLRPRLEVLALAPRVRHAWDALGADDVPFRLDDEAPGWLALADRDHLDQVLWAIFDNAVKYGAGSPVRAHLRPDEGGKALLLTISDEGAGVPDDVQAGIFDRYVRG